MARLTETNITGSAFVDKEDLFSRGVIFTITNAIERLDPPPFGKQVIFDIQVGAEIGQFSLSVNPIRLQYVDYFADGAGQAEPIENLTLYKIDSNKGNPAWGIRDAGDDIQVFPTLFKPADSEQYRLPEGGGTNIDDIPF